jgi:hypothetical protein
MDTSVLLRQARDGEHDLKFMAAVLSATTTARPGAPRWTELTVYRLPLAGETAEPRGGYVVSKVGRSLVAHRATSQCARGRALDSVGDGLRDDLDWVACLNCRPNLNDPSTVLETTRCQVLQARTPADLIQVLLRGRPGDPTAVSITGIVAETITQVRRADADFDSYCGTHLAPHKGVMA